MYYKDDCSAIKVSSNKGSANEFVEFVKEDNVLKAKFYEDKECKNEYKVNNKHLVHVLGECDTCKNGIKFQCSSMAISLLSIVLLIALLF